MIESTYVAERSLATAVFLALRMLEIARTLNPGIETVAYVHSEDEAALLLKQNIGRVFQDEHELASGMSRHLLERAARAAVP